MRLAKDFEGVCIRLRFLNLDNNYSTPGPTLGTLEGRWT